MLQYISKILFTLTVTAPTFLSLALTGIVKDHEKYFSEWKVLWGNHICPNSFDWWAINFSLLFMFLCTILLAAYLNKKYERSEEGLTITVTSYSNLSQNSGEQILSSVIPWLTISTDKLDFKILFFCIILQCCFIAITSYNNNNYNIICSMLGYRHYEVHTKENTYILLSKKCIKNKTEITRYSDITDYIGLIIKNKE